VTVAVNCCVCPALKVTAGGATVIPIAESVIVAFADLLESPWLVAVTVTVCWLLTLAGAV
jgi:hypothetical protein